MNTSKSQHRRRFLSLSLLSLSGALTPCARASEWTVVKYQGRDYVTFDSVKNFYRFPVAQRSGNSILLKSKSLHLKATIGSQALYINNVKFMLSFPVLSHTKGILISRIDLAKLVDPILRPGYIKGAEQFTTVIIDAGHGGADPGAESRYWSEKTYNLDLANRLRSALDKRGLRVAMTRTTDKYLTLTQRVNYANRIPKAVFISLHFNSTGASSASGIETFALSPQGASSTHSKGMKRSDLKNHRGNVRDSENIALATAVHASVMHQFKTPDRGVKRARWTVLTGVNKPAILFEGGFLTNPTELQNIHSSRYRDKMAAALADGIVNYRNALRQ